MGKMKVIINEGVKNLLREKGISIQDGIAYLICLYYGVSPSYIPKDLVRRVLALPIVTIDYTTDTIEWKIPLFEEQEIGFEWVVEWMNLFKKVNVERRGVKRDVLTRMKKFFANNPSVRKDDVFSATKLYLKRITDPIYCKKSHKFIYEADGTSMLLDYVEQAKRKDTNEHKYKNDII